VEEFADALFDLFTDRSDIVDGLAGRVRRAPSIRNACRGSTASSCGWQLESAHPPFDAARVVGEISLGGREPFVAKDEANVLEPRALIVAHARQRAS
jgi:hypothetical protein